MIEIAEWAGEGRCGRGDSWGMKAAALKTAALHSNLSRACQAARSPGRVVGKAKNADGKVAATKQARQRPSGRANSDGRAPTQITEKERAGVG